MRSALRVDRGVVRAHNEDAALSRAEAGLFAVADGMGGHDHGEVASQFIIEALESLPAPKALQDLVGGARAALEAVHERLLETGASLGSGRTIGATAAVLCLRDGRFACLWAGDCRVYRLSGGALSRLTKDHTLVQQLVDLGELHEAEAARHPDSHKVTRAVGASGPLRLDAREGACVPNDRFLLCSDGLTRVFEDAELEAILAEGSCDAIADRLLAAALERGAPDNVAIVVVDA